MLTLSLWKQNCPNQSFDFIGNKLGDGSDGEVFEIIGDLNKVIKISIVCDLNIDYNKIENILYKLKNDQPIICAQVFEYCKIGIFQRECFNNLKQNYILHYYVMEKCFKLTEDEKKVFHTILSHEDCNKIKKISSEKLQEILFGLSKGLDFDIKKIIFFYNSVMEYPIKHLDAHYRNIMKDSFGNFKFVDFDRMEII